MFKTPDAAPNSPVKQDCENCLNLEIVLKNSDTGVKLGDDRGGYMSDLKLTNAEARRLLSMTKRSLIAELSLPVSGGEKEFEVIGDAKKDIFIVKVYRGKIQPLKYNIGARIKKNGTMLLELHMNPSNVHCNPDGQKIKGSHWHIYAEEYGRSYAFQADDIQSESFVDSTISFLTRFNVIEQPKITYQFELL